MQDIKITKLEGKLNENIERKGNIVSKFFGWYKSKKLLGKIVIIFIALTVLTCLCSVPAALLSPSSDKTPTAIASVIDESVSQENSAEPEATTIPEKTATDIPTPIPTKEPTNTPIPTNTPDPNIFRPGTYIVMQDIQPGLYKGQVGTNIFDSCYWERLTDLSGEFGSIIANDNSIGQFYIQIAETDYAFSSTCQFAYLPEIPKPVEEFPKTIGPGMYLVGIDIQPGLYKGQVGEDILDSCYWERSRSALHELGSIIANNNSTGQFYIQVAPTDFALKVACDLEFQN